MKKLIIAIIALLTVVNCSTQAQTKVSDEGQTGSSAMFLEDESKYDFDATVERLTAEVEGKTWKVVAIHDLQQTMEKNGIEVLPVKVFAVCHPNHASKILRKDDERIVSCMMPCRISVYTKSNGKTYISRINPAPMAKAFGGVVEEVMTVSASEIEEMIREIK